MSLPGDKQADIIDAFNTEAYFCIPFKCNVLCILWLFAYCKGGASWLRNKDWSTLDIGKSSKWGVVLFKSNRIILRHYLSILFSP